MPDPASTAGTPELIEHILERFHEAHRRDLPALVAQARTLQGLGVAAGLAPRLEALAAALELHMFKEEMRLFPMMDQGGHTLIGHLIQDLHEEHARHDAEVATLHQHAHGLLSAVATGTDGAASDQARVLLALLDRFVDDLAQHMHIEDEVLFKRYVAASAA